MYDDLCSFQGTDIDESDGPDAAIAYLESKLTLFEHIPGDPLIHILTNLSELYWNRDEDTHVLGGIGSLRRKSSEFTAVIGLGNKIPRHEDACENESRRCRSVLCSASRIEEKGRRYTKGSNALKEQSIYRQAGVAARNRPATRTVLIGKLIVNALVVIPYIVLFNGTADTAPWAVVSVLAWGFVAFVWLLRSFLSRRQLESMSKLTLSCAVLLGGLL